MSDVKRYAIRGFSAALVEEDNGVFVRYDDYARLKANSDAYVRSLEARIKRLTDAGEMCDQLLACFEMEGRKGVNIGRDMWREAKGVQS